MDWTVTNKTIDNRGFQFQNTVSAGFRIEQLRSPRAARDAEFLPVRVTFEDKEVWSFKSDHRNRGFTGMAFLRFVDEQPIIILVSRRELYDVIPVRDLPQRQRIGDDFVGGTKLSDILLLKSLIADEECLTPIWSRREVALRHALAKAAEADREAARLEAEQMDEEMRALRREKRAQIASRRRIFAYTLLGDRRHGIPVVDDEWMSLSDGAFCISVTSYNAKLGEMGELIESFMVKKNGAKKTRHAVTTVTKENPGDKAVKVNNQSFSFKIIPIKGENQEVILVESMADIRTLRDQGLNSGTLAMCPKAGDEGRFTVFKLEDGKIEPVTEVMSRKT